MRIFAVDKNNDCYVDRNGQLAINTGLAALVQTCEHAMRGLLGEMVFSTPRGLPYWETVFTSTPKLRLFEDSARRTLRGIAGVLSVDSFVCEMREGILMYQAVIRSVYGSVTINSTGAANG
jgi:hypothetical protein